MHRRLTRVPPRGPVQGLALLLHGGQEASTDPVLRHHGSWARMALIQGTLSRAVRRHGIAVWLVRNRVRGWNERAGQDPDPVRDALNALLLARSSLPGVPIVLVGHSMGGRTACMVADDPRVVGVCALAPWLPQGSPVSTLSERRLVVAHGSHDERTSAQASLNFVDRARAAGAAASFISVPGGGHALLRHRRTWDRIVREATLSMLGCDGSRS